jgi:hypothetical protein
MISSLVLSVALLTQVPIYPQPVNFYVEAIFPNGYKANVLVVDGYLPDAQLFVDQGRTQIALDYSRLTPYNHETFKNGVRYQSLSLIKAPPTVPIQKPKKPVSKPPSKPKPKLKSAQQPLPPTRLKKPSEIEAETNLEVLPNYERQ